MPKLWRVLVAGGSCLFAWTGPAWAQADADFTLIRDWTPIGTVDSRAVEDTLLLSAGTIHTTTDYSDFVVRFDYRLASPTAGAALLLRANQGANGEAREYAVALDRAGNSGRLSAVGMPMHQSRFTAPKSARTGWTRCEVRVESRGRLRVTIDGAVVSEGSLLDAPGGRIGFRAGSGGIELRAMRVAPIAKQPSAFHTELSRAGMLGVTTPTLKKNPPPVFPDNARDAGISGTGLLEMVVLTDGSVGDVEVRYAPHRYLIKPAIACVKKWLFEPSRKDGVPVAVAVTAEVAFNLTR